MQKAAVSKARSDDVRAWVWSFSHVFLAISHHLFELCKEKRAWQEAELRSGEKLCQHRHCLLLT